MEDAHEIADAKSAEFIRFMDVNVTGTFYVTREISKAMKSQSAREIRNKVQVRGSIVNMASAASFAAQPWMVQYTTSKHAVLGLSKNAGNLHFNLAKWHHSANMFVHQLLTTQDMGSVSTAYAHPGWTLQWCVGRSRTCQDFTR